MWESVPDGSKASEFCSSFVVEKNLLVNKFKLILCVKWNSIWMDLLHSNTRFLRHILNSQTYSRTYYQTSTTKKTQHGASSFHIISSRRVSRITYRFSYQCAVYAFVHFVQVVAASVFVSYAIVSYARASYARASYMFTVFIALGEFFTERFNPLFFRFEFF